MLPIAPRGYVQIYLTRFENTGRDNAHSQAKGSLVVSYSVCMADIYQLIFSYSSSACMTHHPILPRISNDGCQSIQQGLGVQSGGNALVPGVDISITASDRCSEGLKGLVNVCMTHQQILPRIQE